MSNNSKQKRIVTLVLVAVLVFVCVVPFSYVVIYRNVDYYVCAHRIARQIGASPDSFYVIDYVNDYLKANLVPGLTRADVKSKLERFGHVEVLGENKPLFGTTEDTVSLNVCSHPFNAYVIYFSYSQDGEFISFAFDDSP